MSKFIKLLSIVMASASLGMSLGCTEGSEQGVHSHGEHSHSHDHDFANHTHEIETIEDTHQSNLKKEHHLSPRVVDTNGRPIAGALVMIGYSPGNPFDDNILTTGASGQLPIPQQWKTPLPITITADGYVRKTYLNILPDHGNLEVSIADGSEKIEIKGDATEFGKLRRDGKVDFGLVLPALSRTNLLSFDIGMVVSPEVDRISVGPKKVDLPSNVTLPKQRESYIIPITLNKPTYRMYVRRPGFYRLVAAHGQFPLKKVVNEIRDGKSLFDVINYFTFKGAGALNLDVSNPVAGKNIAVNQFQFDSKMPVLAPAYDRANVMVSLGLWETSGHLYPSDLKRIQPNESLELSTLSGDQNRVILSLLTENQEPNINDVGGQIEDAMDLIPLAMKGKKPGKGEQLGNDNPTKLSFVLHAPSASKAPQFLSFIAPPVLASDRIHFDVPAEISGVTPHSTVITLSEVEKVRNGKVKSEKRTRLWEMQTEAWVTSIELPTVDWGHDSAKSYRWEVIFTGRGVRLNKGKSKTGGVLANEITHATRSSVDF